MGAAWERKGGEGGDDSEDEEALMAAVERAELSVSPENGSGADCGSSQRLDGNASRVSHTNGWTSQSDGGSGSRRAGRQVNLSAPEEVEEDIVKMIAENWELYFPFDEFSVANSWYKAIRLFRDFLTGRSCGEGQVLMEGVDIEKATEVVFDFRAFCSSLDADGPLASFPLVLKNNAHMTLQCLGLALCSIRKRISVVDGLGPLSNRISPRFVHFRPITPIRQLKSNHLGKFVAIRGNVVRVSGVRPLVKRMDFSCAKCEEVITKSMSEGRFSPPTHCESEGCKGRVFKPDKPSAITVDHQKVRIQEIDESSNQVNAGAVPRTIDVELTEELVDLIVPGDVVTVTGIVKALNSESLTGKGKRAKGKNKESSLLVLLLEANAIETKSIVARPEDSANTRPSSQTQGPTQSNVADASQHSALVFLRDLDKRKHLNAAERLVANNGTDANSRQKNDIVANLTERDYAMIHTVATEFDFSFLVYSLCPLILGHESVKVGLLLGLAGGTTTQGSRNSVPIRGDVHVLVVGDPGLGKSQMLKAAAAVSPRGVYVCGNTATKSGLTVTMSKDQSGEYSLEAGALVLADRGVCCIDEFDKMSCEHDALLEAMEQQSISIAKAGIVCTLSARSSILAAANPIGGHYNRNKTILENLRMSSPLLSRFDLVFILVDKPNAAVDDEIADYVVDMHLNQRKNGASQRKKQRLQYDSQASSASGRKAKATVRSDEESLQSYLAKRMKHHSEPLPPDMMRKYLAFAKHYCQPRLSLPACRVLQSFYLELRQKGSMCDSTPITTRQLESLVRLAQARAKLELRDLVTENDAKDIVSLLRESLLDAYTDDAGVVDLQRSSGMSMGKVCKALVSQLRRVAKKTRNPNFTVEMIKYEAKIINILHNIPDMRDMIDILNQQCYLLKKGPDKYRLAGDFSS